MNQDFWKVGLKNNPLNCKENEPEIIGYET